jgi:hypothetical protein
MPTKTNLVSLLEKLDLETIKMRLVSKKDWTKEKADRIEILYKNYLASAAINQNVKLVPSSEVDDMWHEHILDTRKYMKDCQEILGYYLHHVPGAEVEIEPTDGIVETKPVGQVSAGIAAYGTLDRSRPTPPVASCFNPPAPKRSEHSGNAWWQSVDPALMVNGSEFAQTLSA